MALMNWVAPRTLANVVVKEGLADRVNENEVPSDCQPLQWADERLLQTQGRSGMARVRSTGTAVTLFCGEPSIRRSE